MNKARSHNYIRPDSASVVNVFAVRLFAGNGKYAVFGAFCYINSEKDSVDLKKI